LTAISMHNAYYVKSWAGTDKRPESNGCSAPGGTQSGRNLPVRPGDRRTANYRDPGVARFGRFAKDQQHDLAGRRHARIAKHGWRNDLFGAWRPCRRETGQDQGRLAVSLADTADEPAFVMGDDINSA